MASSWYEDAMAQGEALFDRFAGLKTWLER
jgi:hypothetical protein